MSKNVTQIIDEKDDPDNSYSGGTVTIITTDENGEQTASTATYYSPSYRAEAIESATQDALNK